MICPNCNSERPDAQRFCTICGTDLHPESGEIVIPKVRQASRWVPVLILVILTAVGIGIFFATAGSTPVNQSNALWFSVENGELYFDESLYIGGSELTVPAEIGGEPVLYLSDGCFSGCQAITTVILPDSLLAVGHDAFADCTALRGIYIPDTVTYIGQSAFAGCTALEAIYVTENLTFVGAGAFAECNKLYYIFYPGSIDDWMLLYAEFINPHTGVFCEEGAFYQGGDPNY